MRSEEKLREIIAEVDKAAQETLGIPFNQEEFSQVLDAARLSRLTAFVAQRIGHLPTVDFLNLLRLLNGDRTPKKEPATLSKRKSQ